MLINRRLITGALVHIAASALLDRASKATAASDSSLKERAARKGIRYGASTQASMIAIPEYRRLIARECAIVTPEVEAKWLATQAQETQFTFEKLDALVMFAKEHKLLVHMHTLVWALGIPEWVLVSLKEGRGKDVLARHIQTICGRYRGQIDSWDVANESINPRGSPDDAGLLMSPWRIGLGPDFIHNALEVARSADPTARLLINEAGLEFDTAESDWRRRRLIKLVETLKSKNAPLDGVGLEAHLATHIPLAPRAYRLFLGDLSKMGIDLHITELDVDDKFAPSDIEQRDNIVAHTTRTFLEAALAETAVKTVITWGLSDRFSYLNLGSKTNRSDGRPSRPLPFDSNLKRKPMWYALADAFDGAPARI